LAEVSRCKRCGAEIEWREIYSRDFGWRLHPFDAGTNISHFKTCPFAHEFRKREKVPTIDPKKIKGPLDYFLEASEE
jgi:hypothetical protein